MYRLQAYTPPRRVSAGRTVFVLLPEVIVAPRSHSLSLCIAMRKHTLHSLSFPAMFRAPPFEGQKRGDPWGGWKRYFTETFLMPLHFLPRRHHLERLLCYPLRLGRAPQMAACLAWGQENENRKCSAIRSCAPLWPSCSEASERGALGSAGAVHAGMREGRNGESGRGLAGKPRGRVLLLVEALLSNPSW